MQQDIYCFLPQFVDIGIFSYFHDKNVNIVIGPPTGIKIRVRVGTSHLYDVYMSEQLKMKYRFYLKQINDVTVTLLAELRSKANFVLFTGIQEPRKLKIENQSNKLNSDTSCFCL